MELHDSDIPKSICILLANLALPEQISLDNKQVLRLDEKKGHFSLVFVDKLLLRIRNNKTHYVLELRPEYQDFFANAKASPTKWLQIQIGRLDEIIALKESLRKVFEYELKRTHGDPFGCCSKYLQCSDSRKCIHEDFLSSLSCHYRINLLEGRIFYGKNMNC